MNYGPQDTVTTLERGTTKVQIVTPLGSEIGGPNDWLNIEYQGREVQLEADAIHVADEPGHFRTLTDDSYELLASAFDVLATDAPNGVVVLGGLSPDEVEAIADAEVRIGTDVVLCEAA